MFYEVQTINLHFLIFLILKKIEKKWKNHPQLLTTTRPTVRSSHVTRGQQTQATWRKCARSIFSKPFTAQKTLKEVSYHLLFSCNDMFDLINPQPCKKLAQIIIPLRRRSPIEPALAQWNWNWGEPEPEAWRNFFSNRWVRIWDLVGSSISLWSACHVLNCMH